MAGWGKLVAGTIIGIAGTVYATNEELRKHLPKTARDLPDSVRRRFDSAVSAARQASTNRREEILWDLKAHGGNHDDTGSRVPDKESKENSAPRSSPGPLHEDDTRPIYRTDRE